MDAVDSLFASRSVSIDEQRYSRAFANLTGFAPPDEVGFASAAGHVVGFL